MIKNLYSKLALAIFLLIAIGLIIWAFVVFKDRDGKVPAIAVQTFSNDSSSSISATDDLTNDKDTDNTNSSPADQSSVISDPTNSNPQDTINSDKNIPPVSIVPNVSGSVLAHITPQHCNSNCQAFANDLKLREYCEQSCGISPIKKVSNCDDKKDIQKDYCNKDLAITKKDFSICGKINDANIKQSCQNRIQQDALEESQNNNPRSNPTL